MLKGEACLPSVLCTPSPLPPPPAHSLPPTISASATIRLRICRSWPRSQTALSRFAGKEDVSLNLPSRLYQCVRHHGAIRAITSTVLSCLRTASFKKRSKGARAGSALPKLLCAEQPLLVQVESPPQSDHANSHCLSLVSARRGGCRPSTGSRACFAPTYDPSPPSLSHAHAPPSTHNHSNTSQCLAFWIIWNIFVWKRTT